MKKRQRNKNRKTALGKLVDYVMRPSPLLAFLRRRAKHYQPQGEKA